MNRRLALQLVTGLTFARVPLVMLFMAGALVQHFHPRDWLAGANLLALILASLTDLFDGYLARRWRVTSEFGALADPLMDKVFYLVVFPTLTWLLACRGEVERTHAVLMLVFTVLYLLRDQWVSFLRAMAAGQADLRANWMGKLRTAISFPLGCLLYLYLWRGVPSRGSMIIVEGLALGINLWSIHVYTRRYAPSMRTALGAHSHR